MQIGYRHTEETRQKISISNTGAFSSQWKGESAKYQALHVWIRSHYGKAQRCENPSCEGKSTQFQWALKKGRKYSRNRDDYLQLCRSCHRKYDITEEFRKKTAQIKRKFFICTMLNCENKHSAKGLCHKHYLRQYKHE